MEKETKCIQAGYVPKNGESRMIPIIQSTTFKYDTSEAMGKLFDLEESGYFYTRLQNPTNDYVAAKIAALEGGTAAMLTSSGQAASFFSVFNICGAGDHVVSAARIICSTLQCAAWESISRSLTPIAPMRNCRLRLSRTRRRYSAKQSRIRRLPCLTSSGSRRRRTITAFRL